MNAVDGRGGQDRALMGIVHLRLRMCGINRALHAAVARRAALSAALDQPELARMCVTDRQVAVLLEQVGELTRADADDLGEPDLSRADPPVLPDPAEQALREIAAKAGVLLPIDELAARFDLTRPELDALLLVAAPEIDPAYERIFGYVVDDLSRHLPCVDLLAQVGARSNAERLLRRRWLGPSGALRRCGLLIEAGASSTEARQELRLAPGLLDFLLGVRLDLAAIAADPGRFDPPSREPGSAPPGIGVDADRLARAGAALAAGTVQVVAVWGKGSHEELVAALAGHAGRPVRRLDSGELSGAMAMVRSAVREALRTAAAVEAILWVTVPDQDGPEAAVAETVLAEELAVSSVPACITGPVPWRAPVLLSARSFLELECVAPTHTERVAMWTAAAPDADQPELERLAARYRLGWRDLAAVASLARTEAVASNGHRPTIELGLERAAAAVSQRRTSRLAGTMRPVRSPDELILPPGEFRQVMEVASFFDAWPRVAERWGFARRAGGRGLKALFTGEPGTGKTLAAEVIASRLGLSLVTTDLSRLVSKWVGETEKNLDTAFTEAEASNAVLFFDEADALFGKRGQVEHGTDRWANLEVGYLLQRLESFDGLVLLASNLRENIDPAFTRRFSIVVHFPRPGLDARIRLWRRAFPPEAPLDDDLDLDALAELDLTGAGIVASARTAALLASESGASAISMAHAVLGVSRQYQREARVLRPGDLGCHAALLEGSHG
jgi:hypothetical protein